jgi:HEAT repeat protein
MNLLCFAAPLLAAAPFLQAFQDSDVDGLRFHRVHLTNGNFIDGTVIKETAASVLLKLRVGEMTIRRDMINRVEIVKMRDRQAPIEVLKKDPGKGIEPDKKSDKGEEKVDRTVRTVETPEAIRKKVDMILFRHKNSPGGDDRDIPFHEIAALGEEASIYLASKVPAFDLKTQDAMAVALINLQNLKRSAKVESVMEGYLNHEAPAVRAVSVNVLASGASEADKIRLFRPMIQDKDKSVRVTVLSSLGSVEDSQWFDALSDVSADPDEDIRSRALRILKNLAERHQLKDQLIRIMVKNLRSNDAGVQRDAIHMISLQGQKENWKDVAPLLRASEISLRSAAAQALLNLAAPESGEELVAAATVERERLVRGYLAAAIQKLRPVKAVEPFIQWLRDSDEEVQKLAEATLRILTGENLGNDPDKWQEWWDKNRPN